jgi:putative phage-type endonuclease
MVLKQFYGMVAHPGIDFIEYTSEAEWLAERTKGIGGSDAAAVLGMSKYNSPLKVYKAKVEGITKDLSDNVYIKKGKDLEALIRNQYVIPYFAEKGYAVRHPQHIFVSHKTPWLRANCDGIAVPDEVTKQHYTENIVVEIKWVSEWGEANWYGDEYYGVPAEYYAQVQHYMVVTGAKKAVVCALFDKSWEMHYFEIPFDAAFAKRLVDSTYTFYTCNMEMKIPPKVDVDLDKAEFIHSLSEATPTISGDEVFESKIAEYLNAKSEADALTKGANAILKDISAMYLDGHRSERFKMSITKCTRTGFNSTKFAEDYPELYKQYLQESEYTRTVVRRK